MDLGSEMTQYDSPFTVWELPPYELFVRSMGLPAAPPAIVVVSKTRDSRLSICLASRLRRWRVFWLRKGFRPS